MSVKGNPNNYFDEVARRWKKKPPAGTPGVQIKVLDHGFDNMMDWITGYGKIEMRVGVIGNTAGNKHGVEGITNGELATIHEYGAPNANIPERAPIRSTFDKNRNRYRKQATRLFSRAFDKGSSPRKALKVLGEVIKGDIQSRILKGQLTPALQDETILAKGGDEAPLLDDGIFANAMESEVK